MSTAAHVERTYGESETARRLGGLVLFLLAAQFMTAIMLAASIAPDYDFSAAAISDLGVIESTALLFNVSLVLVGLLNVVGGYLFYRPHRNRLLYGLFILAGIGALGAGLVPLNRGGLHSLSALLAFVFFNLEAIGTGVLARGAMKPISIAAGALGLVFVVLMVLGDGGNEAAFGPIGHGGTERMIVYPAMLWMLALGGSLMTGRSESFGRDRP
jgi:hypothetical membrane protein